MLKQFINRLIKPKSNNIENKDNVAVARWCIQQFVTCPCCQFETDIIQQNLKRKTNQGTIKITQKVVQRYDKDKFDYLETTTEIPTPPYYGAMCQDTENLDEHCMCEGCGRNIQIKEAHWQYGR